MGESGYMACSLVVYFARCGSRAPIQPARTMSLGDLAGGEDEDEEADEEEADGFRASGRWRYTTLESLSKPGIPPCAVVDFGADSGAVAAMV